ncbi:MAG: hypothetical protein PW788_05510 [Micavibrio sp.]|nr:hypothetical protein [Micavibrio sp.]
MKISQIRVNPRIIAVLALCFLLQGCEQLSALNPVKPQYKPLDSEIAALATPLPAGVQPAPPLYCRVGTGAALFGKYWYDVNTVDFQLQQKQRTTVSLSPKTGNGTAKFQGFFDEDGQKMVFCPITAGPPDKTIACTSVYALDDDLSVGIRRTFDIPDALRGSAITCGSKPDLLQKL